MAAQIPNTKMYSSLLCKGLVLGINKNTFFFSFFFFFYKTNKRWKSSSSSSSSGVTPDFALIAHHPSKHPPFWQPKALVLPLPVLLLHWEHRKFPLFRLLSWRRRSVDALWQSCWVTASLRCMRTVEVNSNRSTSDQAYSSRHWAVVHCKGTHIFIVFKAGRMEVLLGMKNRPGDKIFKISDWSEVLIVKDPFWMQGTCWHWSDRTLSSTLTAFFRNQSSSSSTQYVSNGSWQISHDCKTGGNKNNMFNLVQMLTFHSAKEPQNRMFYIQTKQHYNL